MKILLVCSSGMSTSLLRELMDQYCKKTNRNHTIVNVDLGLIEREVQDLSIILLAPQVFHALKRVNREYGHKIPVFVLKPEDYGTLNAENIIKFAEEKVQLHK